MLAGLYAWWARLMFLQTIHRIQRAGGTELAKARSESTERRAGQGIFPVNGPGSLPRMLALGVVLIACLGVMAACGGDDEKSTTATTAARSSGASPSTSGGAASGSSSAAAGPEIKMVPSIKYDKTELTIDAGKTVTITVNNTDTGMRHNFALYKTKADADADKDEIASTDICTAPCKQTVDVKLAAGNYFFHCDVHPAQMTGTLTAK
jgi:plastocyanin